MKDKQAFHQLVLILSFLPLNFSLNIDFLVIKNYNFLCILNFKKEKIKKLSLFSKE